MATQPINYDSAIIDEFAQRLYRQARSAIVVMTFVGFVLGTAVGAAVAAAAHAGDSSGTIALIGVVIGSVGGFAVGRERAFKLKLAAQIALCQAQIERNTRFKPN